MLATHTHSLSAHPPCIPAPRPSLLSGPRPALADSTNVKARSNVCSPGYPKGSIYPVSSARTGCSWSGFESSTSNSSHPCHYPLSPSPSPFLVTYKAPPTVSISFSAACSQSTPGERVCGSRVQGLEPDLPDVRSVVPFPITSSDGDMDVDMLDGTCVPFPDGHSPSPSQAPRKRRCAQSSVSSSQGSLGMDTKQKRPKKSRRQVAELWWLGVVHRSISHGIEVRRSIGKPDASNPLPSGSCDLDAMDHMLVERIQKRLAENGCVEGRTSPNPLPRISSPSMSLPSLVLLAPSRETSPISSAPLTHSSELSLRRNSTLDGIAASPVVSKAPLCTLMPITSHSAIPSRTSTSHRCHVHFKTTQQPYRDQPRPIIPRRSPSPPARTGAVSANAQTLTLTMPQLVASLTLAYRERSRLRLRGRTNKVPECGNNAGRSPPSVPCQAVPCNNGDALHGEERVPQSLLPHTNLSSTLEMKSPLSRVVYTES